MNAPRSIILPFAGLIACGVMWGASIPLAKIAVSSGHKPMGLIVWQLVFVSLILGAIVLWRREPIRFSPRHLGYYALIGLIGTLIPDSFSYYVVTELPAGILAICLATVPMIALLVALAIRTERFQAKRMLGIALGVSAMALLAIPELRLPDSGLAVFLLLAMVAPACYGIEGNVVERLAPNDVSPIAALFTASVLTTPVAAAMAWHWGVLVDLSQPWGTPEWALLAGSAAHAAAYTGYMTLVALAGAVFSSQISYIVTLCAVLMSLAFLGESYPPSAWLAIAMMFGGLLLVQPAGRMPETP